MPTHMFFVIFLFLLHFWLFANLSIACFLLLFAPLFPWACSCSTYPHIAFFQRLGPSGEEGCAASWVFLFFINVFIHLTLRSQVWQSYPSSIQDGRTYTFHVKSPIPSIPAFSISCITWDSRDQRKAFRPKAHLPPWCHQDQPHPGIVSTTLLLARQMFKECERVIVVGNICEKGRSVDKLKNEDTPPSLPPPLPLPPLLPPPCNLSVRKQNIDRTTRKEYVDFPLANEISLTFPLLPRIAPLAPPFWPETTPTRTNMANARLNLIKGSFIARSNWSNL